MSLALQICAIAVPILWVLYDRVIAVHRRSATTQAKLEVINEKLAESKSDAKELERRVQLLEQSNLRN